MNRWTIIFRSLWFYRRTHLGVLLGAAVAAAVLTGALAVGDSVRDTLHSQAMSRLGKVRLAMTPADAFFRTQLAADIGRQLSAPTAAVLQLPATASLPDGTARANQIVALGVDDDFWKLGPGGAGSALAPGKVVLSQSLARQLHAEPGKTIIVRVQKPSLLPRDAPLSSDEADETSFSANLTVSAIADDAQFGRFGLQPSQAAALNAFVPRAWLQEKAQQAGRANVLLVGGGDLAAARQAVAEHWQLADAGLELRPVPALGMLELRSSAIFLSDAIIAAARKAQPDALGVLTYFVNEIRCGDKTTPYSMVSAIGPLEGAQNPAANEGRQATQTASAPAGESVGDVPSGDIIINDWEAADFGLAADRPADIELTYYVLGPMRELLTRKTTFRLRGVVPMTGLAGDRTLMPRFPGLADSENCSDWKAGIPIDFKKIRPKDEQYWRDFRGTPKAFLSLVDARKIWANRFGSLTAVRWADQPGLQPAVESRVRANLSPEELGFVWQDVREQALAASSPTTDFAGLFLGLSIFLVAAALLLTGLLFSFSIQQRAGEVGTMLAIGLTGRQVRNLMIFEALALSAVGSAVGAAGGLVYTALMLAGLRTLWSGAIAGAAVTFSVHAATLAIGFGAGTIIAAGSMWLVLRRQGRLPARVLLAGGNGPGQGLRKSGRWRSMIYGLAAVAAAGGAVAMVALSGGRRDPGAAGLFFGAGSLLLVAGLLAARWGLQALWRLGGMRRPIGLAMRNVTCRPVRSLATIGLLACGTFLVTAVGANRHDVTLDAAQRSSGTGGFALIARSSLPIVRDLNRPDAQAFYALTGKIDDVRFVSLRVRPGAQADCLNLNRVAQPQVLGVDPEQLADRKAFTFVDAMPGQDASLGWRLLGRKLDDGSIAAVADENTIVWSLGKKLGDTLDYVDDAGRPVKLRLVGMIGNSVLQGSVLISRDDFARHFGKQEGVRMLLVDCPPQQAVQVASLLTRQLWTAGLEATPAWQRLAELSEVENTYLTIFQMLGGLGLMLGAGGLALVVLRNVLERRAELALMRAIGYSRGRLAGMVLGEHALLLAAGLAIGLIAAGVAVLPALASPGAPVPYVSLSLTLLAVVLNGLLWIYLAGTWSLRGNLIQALRNE